MPDINLTIDGKPVTVPAGTLIVEAAKTVGIEIPVFCYHHKLDPVGACRLCLVDFSPGPPRPQTACTTPVAEGMVVRTQSAMAVQARADILEFELANHPLDCPVCDKGDLCPVGALTSRLWRFESRPWDMTHTETICSRCAVGCSVTQWQRRGQLVRITSHENDDIDEGWICDRGRFDYTDVNDPSRLRTPSILGAKATWADAINAVVAGIKGRGAKLGISLPQDLTNEEAF